MTDIERQKLLGAFKRGLEPTLADRDRNAVAIAAKIGAAAAAGAGAAGTTKGASALKLALSAKLKLALFVIGTSGAVAGAYELHSISKASSSSASAPTTTPPTTVAEAVPAATSTSTTPVAAVEPAAAPPELAAARPEVASVVPPHVPPSRTAHGSGAPTSHAANPTAAEPSLAGASEPAPAPRGGDGRTATNPASLGSASLERMTEEIALVRAMHEAIAGHDPARAITLSQDHARRFPDGRLGLEVEGLRIVAECQRSGKTTETARAAASFVSRHPRAPIVDRVRAACE
jgi:hypothetical protein